MYIFIIYGYKESLLEIFIVYVFPITDSVHGNRLKRPELLGRWQTASTSLGWGGSIGINYKSGTWVVLWVGFALEL